MSFGLTLTGPPDLSVGRVRLFKGEQHIGEWVVSPDKVAEWFTLEEPGTYRATTEPLGQPSRSFMFELKATDSAVAMPSLQAMASADFALANYLGVLAGQATDSAKQLVQSAADNLAHVIPAEVKAMADREPGARLTIGVSRSATFEPRAGQPVMLTPRPEVTLLEGALEIVLHRPDAGPGRFMSDVVLTCAVDSANDVSVRVPFYAGGVRFFCTGSVLGLADLSYRMLPVDRTRRAITQALFAGSSREAAPVMAMLAGIGSDDWQDDPWTAVASALLAVRFPDLDSHASSIAPAELFHRFAWLTDAYVLEAHAQLRTAWLDASRRDSVLGDVADLIVRAGAAGPPFFAYSSQLMDDVLSALDREQPKLAALRRFKNCPRPAGASYAWLMSETPSRTGRIDPRIATTLVSGRVHQDRITLDTGAQPNISEALTQIATPLVQAVANSIPGLRPAAAGLIGSQPWGDAWQGMRGLMAALGRSASPPPPEYTPRPGINLPPGLARPVTAKDDPFKGRFGGQASREDFTLGARFIGGETAKLVRVVLVVTGAEDFSSFDEVAEFFLHPTFRPSRLSVAFQGRAATVEIVSRGGFTVGVWLPNRSVELELDLTEAPLPPRVIREL